VVSKEVVEKISDLMTAAFGLVAALAWNNVIQSLFAAGGPLNFVSDWGPWAYAISVTVIAVIATLWIGRAAKAAKQGRLEIAKKAKSRRGS